MSDVSQHLAGLIFKGQNGHLIFEDETITLLRNVGEHQQLARRHISARLRPRVELRLWYTINYCTSPFTLFFTHWGLLFTVIKFRLIWACIFMYKILYVPLGYISMSMYWKLHHRQNKCSSWNFASLLKTILNKLIKLYFI